MSKADRYLLAGTRENTRRSYRTTVEHFEVTWGGFLPATGDGIMRYLAEYPEATPSRPRAMAYKAGFPWPHQNTRGTPDD